MSIGPDKTVDRFWCDVCNNWHTDSTEAPVTVCYYCGAFCVLLSITRAAFVPTTPATIAAKFARKMSAT